MRDIWNEPEFHARYHQVAEDGTCVVAASDVIKYAIETDQGCKVDDVLRLVGASEHEQIVKDIINRMIADGGIIDVDGHLFIPVGKDL